MNTRRPWNSTAAAVGRRGPRPLGGALLRRLLGGGSAVPARATTTEINYPSGPITIGPGEKYVIVTGGSVTATGGHVAVIVNGGTLIVTDGSISGDIGIQVKSGTVKISGGSISTHGGDGVGVFGGTVKISGGTISGTFYGVEAGGGGTLNIYGCGLTLSGGQLTGTLLDGTPISTRESGLSKNDLFNRWWVARAGNPVSPGRLGRTFLPTPGGLARGSFPAPGGGEPATAAPRG